MRIIDLTLPLDECTPVYEDVNGYRDPSYKAEPWATISDQGYGVHRLELGSHTGTHLDAPAHFVSGGPTVDEILPSRLVGRVVVIDLCRAERVTPATLQPYTEVLQDGGLLLFLAPTEGVQISVAAVHRVAAWKPAVILYGGVLVDEAERYYHNRFWLAAGIPLVTDLDPDAAAQVRDGDFVIVAPLRLVGLDGSPCRVLAIRDI
jgi:kynurenine formamidase